MKDDILKKEEIVSTNNNLNPSSNNKKTIIVVFLIIIIIGILGVGIYFTFVKKDDNKNNNNQEQSNNLINADVYKTTDGKFTLKISNNIGYINDTKITIVDKKEDEKYIQYYANIGELSSNSDLTFLIDKNSKVLIGNKSYEDKDTLGEFAIFSNTPLWKFVKTKAGYVYTVNSEDSYCEVYTTDWKLIGYIPQNSDIKSDANGIYLFNLPELAVFATNEDDNNFLKVLNESMIKYKINGDRIDGLQILKLSDKEQNVNFNNQQIVLKLLNGKELYLNDKKINTFEDEVDCDIVVTNDFILLHHAPGQCTGGDLIGLINKNNEFVKYSSFAIGLPSIFALRIENDKLVGVGEFNEIDLCGKSHKIEISYDGKNVNIKKID